MPSETQIAIVGAGPAGLMLSHLLHLNGISSIVLEARSRSYCEERVRAGVLEHTSVEMLRRAGVADRLDREGLRHEGIELGLNGIPRSGHIPGRELRRPAARCFGGDRSRALRVPKIQILRSRWGATTQRSPGFRPPFPQPHPVSRYSPSRLKLK